MIGLMLKKLSLRFTLTLGILAMGGLGILLAQYVGETYRQVAIDSQRVAYRDIVHLRVGDLLSELKKYSQDLGHATQNHTGLRQAMKTKDRDRVEKYLNSQFHQYFVTVGVLKLNSLIAHDAKLNRVGIAWDEHQQASGIGGRSCDDLLIRARSRAGPQRLKMISELCLTGDYPFLHVLVPIGGLRVLGYLEIVTDPTHSLIAIERDLGMPVKIKLFAGKLMYESTDWPAEESTESVIIATHVHKAGSGKSAFTVAVVRDIKEYQQQLRSTSNTLMLSASIVTLIAAGLMLWFVHRTTLTPLHALRSHLDHLRRDSSILGEQVQIKGNFEVMELASGFNDMTKKLRQSYDEIRQTNDDLKAEVNERINAEQQLKLNQDHLEELVEMRTADLAIARDAALNASESKSQFLANMSHELRTPLNAIIGYSEMMIEDSKANRDGRMVEDLSRVHKSGLHLLSLINDILDLSKVEAGKVELIVAEFNIKELIDDIINTITPSIERNRNNLVVECPDDIGVMRADAMKIRQSLLNLLSNAAKFTEAGTITCRVKRILAAGEEKIEFVVSDTGIGIPEEELKQIFKPFSQADDSMTRKYGGTGLGLAITQRFCWMMGGEVTVESVPGKGSLFRIVLPAEVEETEHYTEIAVNSHYAS